MKRRMICLLLAACMLVTAGCGKKKEEPVKEPEVEVKEEPEVKEPEIGRASCRERVSA